MQHLDKVWSIHNEPKYTQTFSWPTRRSENNNPQPLDQWMNSPFIGQQVGNCKSFTLTHYLADLFAKHHGQSHCASNFISNSHPSFNILPSKSKLKVMGEVKVCSHNVSLTFYWLTSLLSYVNRPSHPWDMPFSKYDLENPRSRSWVRWTLKVTTWVQHSLDLHPLCPMSIHHHIPQIRLIQNLTLKIQGQGHGWGESWKS